ncbi:MAG: HAMP domain-containing histidine kinase [Firmicutes bacterium]|nr:HAMP domain-containing histidine kinase [Bacillota bacterium]
MKFSLRYKLPLVIFCGFALFIALLIFYYRLYLMDNLGRDFDVFKDHFFGINEVISARIKQYYPDFHRIQAYLEKESLRKDLKITVYDVNGNKIWVADRRKSRGLSLELMSFTVVDRDLVYVVELSAPFSADNFSKLNSIRMIGWVALILLLVFSGLLIIYLHFSLVRPLTFLNRSLETVDYRFFAPETNLSNHSKRRDELGDLTCKFVEMRQRLATSYRRQNEMIASISHDLKTPLTSIIGFLERLMSRQLSDRKQAEYHRIIFQKAQDMAELIREFNEYALCDFDAINGEKEEVDLQEFLSELAAEYRCEFEGRKIVFEYIFDVEEDFRLEIDRQKIRRVLANLINNSLKHAANLNKITMKCAVRKGYAWFAVEDDGHGVPPQELTAIFEQFYRIDKSRSRSKGGSGLGLAICRRIVASHGGSIEAYLNGQGGLGVRFSMPLKS